MPNHCHNRVTFYSANTEAVAKLKQIFEDEECFTQIIPEPDWENTPLMSSDMPKYDWDKPKGKLGELPQMVETPYGLSLRFVSTCLLYTSPSPRDLSTSRMPSSA